MQSVLLSSQPCQGFDLCQVLVYFPTLSGFRTLSGFNFPTLTGFRSLSNFNFPTQGFRCNQDYYLPNPDRVYNTIRITIFLTLSGLKKLEKRFKEISKIIYATFSFAILVFSIFSQAYSNVISMCLSAF